MEEIKVNRFGVPIENNWVYITGTESIKYSRNILNANSTWAKKLIEIGLRVGYTSVDGVISYYIKNVNC